MLYAKSVLLNRLIVYIHRYYERGFDEYRGDRLIEILHIISFLYTLDIINTSEMKLLNNVIVVHNLQDWLLIENKLFERG